MVKETSTFAAAAYHNQEVVQRRHRHRYEFNNAFREQFEEAGFVFSGVSPDNRLVEIVEIPENKFFVACQYHPELSSRPNRRHSFEINSHSKSRHLIIRDSS